MHRLPRPLALPALLLIATACATSTPPSAAPAEPTVDAVQAPGSAAAWPPHSGPWRMVVDPEEAGFSAAALEEAHAMADTAGSAAVFAVHRGRVIAAWGDVGRELRLHSVRKSLVSGLYGTAFGRGEVDPEATLADLGIDDTTPLTSEERTARVVDLLASRSGVYLGAAYAPKEQREERPERGSHPPGERFFYNNWDFNALGVIYERATGEDLFASFARRLAEPLGMEDWAPEDGLPVYEPGESRHPAHTFRMSARDLARYGQLYLQEGRWGDEQVLSAEWVRNSTLPRIQAPDGRGYALLWWTYEPGALGDDYPVLRSQRIYAGQGTGGQLLAVIPGLDLVVVHRADTDHEVEVPGQEVWKLVEAIAAARVSAPAADPELVAVRPTPLASQRPAYVEPPAVPVSQDTLADYYGRYRLFPGIVARVFEWQERPFVFMPGEGEAELFAIGEDTFTVRVISRVEIEFRRGDDGEVDGLVAQVADKTYRARKVK